MGRKYVRILHYMKIDVLFHLPYQPRRLTLEFFNNCQKTTVHFFMHTVLDYHTEDLLRREDCILSTRFARMDPTKCFFVYPQVKSQPKKSTPLKSPPNVHQEPWWTLGVGLIYTKSSWWTLGGLLVQAHYPPRALVDSWCRPNLHQEPWWTLGVGPFSTKSLGGLLVQAQSPPRVSSSGNGTQKLAFYLKTKWPPIKN